MIRSSDVAELSFQVSSVKVEYFAVEEGFPRLAVNASMVFLLVSKAKKFCFLPYCPVTIMLFDGVVLRITEAEGIQRSSATELENFCFLFNTRNEYLQDNETKGAKENRGFYLQEVKRFRPASRLNPVLPLHSRSIICLY